MEGLRDAIVSSIYYLKCSEIYLGPLTHLKISANVPNAKQSLYKYLVISAAQYFAYALLGTLPILITSVLPLTWPEIFQGT